MVATCAQEISKTALCQLLLLILWAVIHGSKLSVTWMILKWGLWKQAIKVRTDPGAVKEWTSLHALNLFNVRKIKQIFHQQVADWIEERCCFVSNLSVFWVEHLKGNSKCGFHITKPNFYCFKLSRKFRKFKVDLGLVFFFIFSKYHSYNQGPVVHFTPFAFSNWT